MNKLFIVLAAVALVGCATNSPDRDNASRVSYAEFVRILHSTGFDKADKNRSGDVAWDEWQQFDTTPESHQHFDSLDTDRDGKVSREEWKNGLNKTGVSLGLFKQLDADNDGYLGSTELKSKPVSGLFHLNF